jgi:hypothetical protein
LDLRVLAVLEDLKLEFERVQQHKTTQKEKHNLGKDQANASWTSTLPAYGSAIPEQERPGRLAADPEPEEEEQGVPAFVSNRPSISDVQGDAPGIKGTFKKTVQSLTPLQPVPTDAAPAKTPRRRLLEEDDEL